MSHYKPYPAYKDSGVEWLGRIPEHWEITPLKYEAEFVNGAAFKPEQWSEIGTPIIRIENLNGSLNFNCFDGEMDARYHVEQGDLLFGWSGNRGTSFGPFIWPHAGRHYLNQHIFRICNFKFDKAWFYWSLKAVTAHVEDQAHGIIGMVHITKGDLGAIKIATPALAEQQAISAHLDRETARIDALIVKKTRFIELLREKRQALITHAVTKGLDPNVTMKDSGVEWLGEVPEHWDVLSFQRCVFIAEGQVDPEKSPYREMVLLAPNHIESGSGLLLYTETAEEQNAESGKYLCQKGDVVYSKIRPALRKVCIAPDLSLCSADMYPMRGHSGMSNQFLFWFLLSEPFSAFAVLEADRVAMPKINRESLNSVQLPRPPINEQVEIVAWVAQSTARLDNLRAKTERSIELLKERRSALITAAVTGQIDLREAV